VLVVNYFGSASLQAFAKWWSIKKREMERDSSEKRRGARPTYIGEGAAALRGAASP
jgi:hypothetical protein